MMMMHYHRMVLFVVSLIKCRGLDICVNLGFQVDLKVLLHAFGEYRIIPVDCGSLLNVK
jgi:hypothetical protein